MGGYDLDEYDDYEDEGEEQEEDIDEEEEEEEEERQPTQEELEYLELRQKLKESIRKKMTKDSSITLATNSREKKNKLPYDNFGSFFGPSQPVIAQRVIQESKSLLENVHLAARVSKDKNVQNRGGSSTPTVSKPRANEQPRDVKNIVKPKAKIQMLKDTRDYSFLLSDDAELPASTKSHPKSISTPKEAHSSQKAPNNNGRKVINGREERKPLPTVSQMRPKADPQSQSQRPSTAGKSNSTSLDSRKQLGRNAGSGPGRPSGPKPLPSKMPVASKERAISSSASKTSINGERKLLPSKPLSTVHKKPLEHKRDDRESSKGNTMIKKTVLPSRPQMRQPPAKLPPSAQQKERMKKRPVRPFSDDEEDGDKAISIIRNMFRYNPDRYRGANDDDDSDMEAGFEDIMKEEKRSARIAAKEDEEELKKIEEEERRERMRKEAKKRKLNQR